MNIRERLGKELLFLDGGMGTLLQAEGLAPGELPETWNIEHPEKVEAIHRRYYEAGSDVVLANTFGANVCKFHDDRYTVEEVIRAGIANAKRAGEQIGKETYVALDMGPTGKLLKPMGDLDFDDAYEAFAEAVRYGEKYGADLIHIETMSDTYEVKAAILAAKENSSLPVFVTMIFDERGKLLTGGDVPSVVAMLEGLRVDALGLNCGLGPKQMLPILNDLRRYTSLPIIVKPNAGLPKQKNGETYYDVEPDEFARIMQEVVKGGACVIGGCCGTTPEHIKKLVEECKDLPLRKIEKKHDTIVNFVTKERLDQLSETGKHQGVIAYAAAYEYATVEEILDNARQKGEAPFLFLLDNIEDPHNLGAIIRTANLAGAHGVIVPKNRAAGLTAVVAKTSAGALNFTPVARVTNLAKTIEELKKEGIWFVCADMGGTTMYDLNLKGPIGLVIGNEGEGVGRLVKEKCDMVASIPMKGDIDSLNASVAAGVLAYEIVRQRLQ